MTPPEKSTLRRERSTPSLNEIKSSKEESSKSLASQKTHVVASARGSFSEHKQLRCAKGKQADLIVTAGNTQSYRSYGFYYRTWFRRRSMEILDSERGSLL